MWSTTVPVKVLECSQCTRSVNTVVCGFAVCDDCVCLQHARQEFAEALREALREAGA